MIESTGLIHIYCGDGKGKSTAATGLAIRCLGGGGRVYYYQFLKDGTSGELNVLKRLDGIKVADGYKQTKFTFQMNDVEKKNTRIHYHKEFEKIVAEVSSGKYQLCILDEVLHAINSDFIDLESMIHFLKNKPDNLEVVLTGRNPKSELCEIADYITEMAKLKHPFDKGIPARKLIEK